MEAPQVQILPDDGEDSENIDTQNSSVDSGVSDVRRKERKFKKHPWLNDHFGFIEEPELVIFCKKCDQTWKNRCPRRMVAHYKNCSRITCSIEESPAEMDGVVNESSLDRSRNNMWAMLSIEANIASSTIELPICKALFRDLAPDWKLPNRQDLSNVYIPRLSRKLLQKFISLHTKAMTPSLSVEFDHWRDANGRSFLGIILTGMTGERCLLRLTDVSLKGHFSDAIRQDLEDALKIIPSTFINSIVSDAAASCKKARANLVILENYKYVIQHRCLAHLLNNIGHRITSKNEQIASNLSTASKITSFISMSTYWQAYIKKSQLNKVKPACPTRWYSTVNMISSLIDLKAVILENIRPAIPQDNVDLIDNLDWNLLEATLKELKPLNQCIGQVEGKATSLGEGFGCFLNYTRNLFGNEEPLNEIRIAARESILWYFSPKKMDADEFGLYLASYVLDRRNEMRYITEEGVDLALEAIALVKTGLTSQRIRSGLIDEFQIYRNFREDYEFNDRENNPTKWWSSRQPSVLSRVAMRIANLKATSTNLERTFSTLKNIQGGSRLNLSIATLTHICRLKISQGVIYEDEEEFDINNNIRYDQALIADPNQGNNSQPASEESSEITLEDISKEDWLEHLSREVVESHKRFFRLIDFSVISEPSKTGVSTEADLTREEIRRLIRASKTSSQSTCGGVTYDSASQVAEYNEAFTFSDNYETSNQ